MPPSETTATSTITLREVFHEKKLDKSIKQKECNNYETIWGEFKTPLIWTNIISITLIHLMSLYGLIIFPYFDHKLTVAWWTLIGFVGGFGVTAGAHRLWCHRSYKAKLPLRIILMTCYCMAGQNRLYHWVRDHRVHHKYSETDADPHNSHRGFFFAHVGWLMMKKHPEVLEKGKLVDCTDLQQDPVVVFHEKYFTPLKLFWCFIVPTAVPYYVWNETFYWTVLSSLTRYVLGLNFTWLVNSAAHIFGNKPYDRNIHPSENLTVSILSLGEGWHNYHHTFPWDYKAAELGNYTFNITTMWLDLFAKFGLAYDLKTPSSEVIEKTIRNRGDGTHPKAKHKEYSQEEITARVK